MGTSLTQTYDSKGRKTNIIRFYAPTNQEEKEDLDKTPRRDMEIVMAMGDINAKVGYTTNRKLIIRRHELGPCNKMKTFSGHYHRRHSISTQKDPQNNMDIP
jgi:hypothetical protein